MKHGVNVIRPTLERAGLQPAGFQGGKQGARRRWFFRCRNWARPKAAAAFSFPHDQNTGCWAIIRCRLPAALLRLTQSGSPVRPARGRPGRQYSAARFPAQWRRYRAGLRVGAPGGIHNGLHIALAAADENSIRRGQILQRFRGFARDQPLSYWRQNLAWFWRTSAQASASHSTAYT